MFNFQIQKVESELQPLKESNRAVTSQKDSLLAEKTALKNEVGVHVVCISVYSSTLC